MTHEKPPLLLPLPGETRPLRVPRGRLHRETSGRSRAPSHRGARAEPGTGGREGQAAVLGLAGSRTLSGD